MEIILLQALLSYQARVCQPMAKRMRLRHRLEWLDIVFGIGVLGP